MSRTFGLLKIKAVFSFGKPVAVRPLTGRKGELRVLSPNSVSITGKFGLCLLHSEAFNFPKSVLQRLTKF